MAKTLDQLVRRAIGILNEQGAGEAVDVEDTDLLKSYAPDLFAQLRASEIIDVADANAIDEAVFTPLARMLANEVAPEFGAPRDQAIFDGAELQIRRTLPRDSTPNYRKQQYF